MVEFEAQTAEQKRLQIWGEVTDPSVVGKSGPTKGDIATVAQILTESMRTPFDDQWEVMPKGRTKVIHAQGVHCAFNLSVSSESPFTGILAAGNQAGIIRMGSAGPAGSAGSSGTIFPGLGIKFLRSGVRSADFVALRTTGPGGAWNFFDSVFANHVAPPSALVKLGKFQQASGCIDMVGLSDVCSYTQAGAKVEKPVFPFNILFEPTGKANFSNVKKTDAELLHELSSIKAGTDIFNVYTYASPKAEKAGEKVLLGKLSTTSPCYQSLFGDEHLFFRHQRMEEDFALMPDWIDEMKELGDPVCVATVGPVSKWQCTK